MGGRANLTGRYRVLNEASLHEKAKRTFDPSSVYQAILSNGTYEAYFAAVGDNRGQRSRRDSLCPSKWLVGDDT